MSLRKCRYPSIEKCSQILMLHSFSDVDASFSSVSSQGRVFLHSCSQLRTCLADH